MSALAVSKIVKALEEASQIALANDMVESTITLDEDTNGSRAKFIKTYLTDLGYHVKIVQKQGYFDRGYVKFPRYEMTIYWK